MILKITLFILLENKDQSLKSTKTVTKIRFTEDSGLEEFGNLMRIPTPHPKKMRAFAKMLLEKKKKIYVIILLINSIYIIFMKNHL